MLSFFAFTPHSPLLLPEIGREQTKKLEKTREAMNVLRERIQDARPDTVVIISSHGIQHEEAFSINLHETYTINLESFGHLDTQNTFTPDLELITRIQRRMRSEDDLGFTLDSAEGLDHGSGVPLQLLYPEGGAPNIVPIAYSGLNPKAHARFGRILHDLFQDSPKRIAVIASGDLSHCLATQSPMGFQKEGQQFDDIVVHAVKQVSQVKLLSLTEPFIDKAEQCAHKPLLTLMGVLDRTNVQPEILSYEAPFGVGYLTVQFHISESV